MGRVNYTPFAHLTDEELLREVYMKKDVTDLEIELSERLDYLTQYLATIDEEIGVRRPETRYVEVA